VNGRLTEAARALPDRDLRARERFVALFGFHTAAVQVERQLADAYAAADRFAEAENLLLRQYRSADRGVAASALERLARLMREAGLPSDADYYYRLLATHFPEVELAPGVTASALVQDLREQGRSGAAEAADAPQWKVAELTLSRIGTNYGARYVQQLIDDRSAVPFFREHRVEIDLQQQRLAVVNVADNSLHWLLPLRSGNTGGRDLVVAGRSNGHLLFVLHRDVLHCVSPVRRRILWSHPLDPQAQASGYAYSSANLRPMQQGTRILSRHSLLRQARSGGLLAVANDQYVCVYGRRRFTVLDTLTGAERWSFEGTSRETLLVGNEDVLYLVSADRSEVTALRSLDGKILDIPGAKALLSESVAILPTGLLHVGTQSSFLGLSRPQTVVRLYDPLTKQEHWRRAWTSDTYLSLLDDGRLLALGAAGQLECVETASGRVTRFEDVPPEQMAKSPSEIFAVAEADALYLVVNGQWQPGFRRQYSSQELPSVRVNGFVNAFDAASGRRLWVREATQQNLLRQGSALSPLLIFASKEYVQEPDKGLGYWRMNLLVLDKQTGTTLIETTGSGNYSFQSIDVNAAEQYVELRTNNQILRLQAADAARASVEPAP
jgi:outer membrane protein assembly factor BamB